MIGTIDGWGSAQLGPDPASWPAVLVRTYQGKLADAAQAAGREASDLAEKGYVQLSQTYAPGSWSGCAFLIALALILVVGLGLLIIAYMVIVKPPGTLTVTYGRQVSAPPQPESPAFQAFPSGG